jgi:electron transport complex protein RnfC
MLKFTPRRRLTGGARLAPHKTDSTQRPIQRGLIPPRLIISTRQHHGPASAPVVAIGQTVARGDTLARAVALEGADVHAPTSGTVVAVEPHAAPLFSGVAEELCIVIDTDGREHSSSAQAPIEPAATTAERIAQISSAGVVGLGGAVYPTAAKLSMDPEVNCKMLIINGAECEPYISCDDMLMREAPEEIIRGAEMLRQIVGAAECIIAVERDKPQAIDALTAAAQELNIEGLRVAELPSIYPAGGERQLVEVLTGVEVAHGSYPGEFGILCQNVGTAYSVHHYFRTGEPLTSRIITVTGSAVAEPQNVEAMIGTPIADLIAACGGYRSQAIRLIHGGSMMGFALATDALPITKATNCIVAADATEVRLDTREWPCIRCGECSIACPARLQPQDLLVAARASNLGQLDELALSECIECGLCDVVCPSHIPLTEIFRQAKPLLRDRGEQQAFAAASDERFRTREHRRAAGRQTEDRQRDALKQALEQKDGRARAIQAAVDRARQRKPGSDGS